ncbi:hypothetical protein KC19_VG312300 [Ceratodon purpureus]|nr:hypothetical protein KC19_VG312300 [Ceratodon purpureus]KAG0575033.1 hypothetical protein KC19_VG312300 [Ceratodon purpureus]KAG0575034.1 hypothetical protein KC19_VG312300 [Ceratodon purpureus]KAG0575035.1 hypothetical protein KC19_VG312300 [Ceratodon purpureus]
MPPRAINKEKRGPELWNPKKRKASTDDSQKEDGLFLGSASRGRSKYPPGPDAATAVTDEFFNLPPSKCSVERDSPSLQAPQSSHIPVSEDRVGDTEFTMSLGNEVNHPVAVSTTPEFPFVDDRVDDYDEPFNRTYSTHSQPVAQGQTDQGGRAEMPHVGEKYLGHESTKYNRRTSWEFSRSPRLKRRRSRSRRRYSYSESDESGHRRRRSHRSRRRHSRRSSSRSTSSSSLDRGRRRDHDSKHGNRSCRSHDRPYRDAAPQKLLDTDLFDEENMYSRLRSPAVHSRSGTDVPSPSPRGYELRVPFSNEAGEQDTHDYARSEQGHNGSGRGSCSLHAFSLKKESADRKDRRERHKFREDTANRRVEVGKKRYYVHVNEDGQPYGYGVGLWNETVGKLVRGLDPSYIDIRQQPFHLMDTMISRLNEDFDYSHNVNSAWLRRCIGSAVSSYCHELMKIIEAKGDRRQWVTEDIWIRLITMANSEMHKIKPEQMKHANACKISKGRTGPIGIAGVTERLRLRLGRSPDPDEIQEEVTRDKSQDRRPRKRCTDLVSTEALISPVITAAEDTRGTPSISAVASTEIIADPVPSAEAPVVNGNRRYSPVSENHSNSLSVDPDIAFARGHPLGKVLLKQMEELRSIQGCDTPELQLILDGIMSQIWNMRQSSKSASLCSQTTSPVIHEKVQTSCNDSLEELRASCTQIDTSAPCASSIPVSEALAHYFPGTSLSTTAAPSTLPGKSGRKPTPKNRGKSIAITLFSRSGYDIYRVLFSYP